MQHETSQPLSKRVVQGLHVVVATATLLLAPAAMAQSSTAFELRDGVLVDPTAAAVYAMSPGGGLDAVSLDQGLVQWHTDEAELPLAASAAGILAMAEIPTPGSLELVLLDAAGRSISTTSVALPSQVRATVSRGLSTRFEIQASPVGAQTFQVDWQWSFTAVRGAVILDQPVATQTLAGSVMVNPTSGSVQPGAPAPGPSSPPTIEVPAGERLQLVGGTQYRSVDGGHVLGVAPGVGQAADTYEWTIYTPGGTPLGNLTNRAEYVPFYANGALVLFESRPASFLQAGRMVDEPLMLRAVSISNGAEQWRVALRDTEYRGPLPP